MAKKAAKRTARRTPAQSRARSGRKSSGKSRTSARAKGGRRKVASVARSRGKQAARAGGRKTAGTAKRTATRKPARRPVRATSVKTAAARPEPAQPRATRKREARPRVPARHAPGLERERRQLKEVEENVPTPPSSLDLDRTAASAARSGRREMRESRLEHTEASPELTAGDVDADWEEAYSVGDEAPGGDNPTPDQDRVDDIGKALGVEYQDNEELKASDKIAERDRHRWELDPASSEDYQDRD
jgi:uncharacterized protein DUF6335